MRASQFFSETQKQELINAIKDAELNTSGEIRLHVEMYCREDVLDHAAFIFEELQMHKTKLRNGVLFYVAINDKKFAILGDAGINAAVPEGFWNETKDLIIKHFKEGNYTEGLAQGIRLAGEQLKKHFPYQKDDVNELSDDISFGTNKS